MSPTAKPFVRSTLSSPRLNSLVRYVLMTLLALLLFGIILLLSGKNPIQSYKDILTATLGSAYGFSEVLVAMIPMLITALAVALPARVGLINVGGEGQLYIGAAFATWGALAFQDQPAWILLPVMTLLSTRITEVVVSSNKVSISGEAKVTGKRGYTFTATVVDGKKDSFGIVIRKPNGTTYYDAPLKPACSGEIRLIPLE